MPLVLAPCKLKLPALLFPNYLRNLRVPFPFLPEEVAAEFLALLNKRDSRGSARSKGPWGTGELIRNFSETGPDRLVSPGELK